jgi:hypothetical protein
MRVLERALLSAAAATLLSCGGAYAQSTGNLLDNPDMVLEANDGRTSQTVRYPAVSRPVVFGGSAAAYWAYITVPLGNLTIDTELVPSDFISGNQMLHVRAHDVAFMQLRPVSSDTSFGYGRRATFCAWVKVAQGSTVGVQADDTGSGGTATGDWQQLVDSTDATTANGPAITVFPQRPPGDTGTGTVLGDVDFYVATADYTPRRLTACPRATLDDVSIRRQPFIVPPREPRVQHPDWNDPDHGGGDAQRRRGIPPKPDQKPQQIAPPPDK